MESYNYNEHWDNVYNKTDPTKLGWYQAEALPSLEIIKELDISRKDQILVVGAGLTMLADGLIENGYHNLIFSDISKTGLAKLEVRLKSQGNEFSYIVDDLTKSTELSQLREIAVWHDRAVLHFLTEDFQKQEYIKLMHKVVRIGGYAIIAVFSLDGAAKCSGLDVCRYSQETIDELLGEDFKLIKSFDYTYIQPSGNERPYVYTVFKRIA
ncbi:MAG: class I SAM-dependent methyltransferase [Candidatus Heimdallarchaeota archaeon]|nr:class I SAM-dependent methyltransferase [Candidatus Heimdallarchaeota archaeon]